MPQHASGWSSLGLVTVASSSMWWAGAVKCRKGLGPTPFSDFRSVRDGSERPKRSADPESSFRSESCLRTNVQAGLGPDLETGRLRPPTRSTWPLVRLVMLVADLCFEPRFRSPVPLLLANSSGSSGVSAARISQERPSVVRGEFAYVGHQQLAFPVTRCRGCAR